MKFDSESKPIEFHFDEQDFDSIESLFRQSIADGKSIAQFLDEQIDERLKLIRADICCWWFDEMLNARNARLRAVEIGLACGSGMTGGKNLSQWAKEFRITKQAISLGVKKIQKKLRLRKSRAMRSDSGCENMAKSKAKGGR